MIYLHQPVACWVIHRSEGNSRQGVRLDVGFDDLGEVYPCKDVSVRRDERSFVKILLCVLYSTAVPKGCSSTT